MKPKIVLIIREPYTNKRAVVLLDYYPDMRDCFFISQHIKTKSGKSFSHDRAELTFELDYLQEVK